MSGNPRRTLIIVLGVVMSLPLLALGGWMVFLNGGIVNTIRNLTPEPDPESAALKSSRAALEAEIGVALDNVGSKTGFASYGTAKDDMCNSGSNTFMRSDRYAHSCTLRLTRIFSFDGDFRQTMIEFERALHSLRWENGSQDRNMEYYLIHYYDHYRGSYTVDRIARPHSYHRQSLTLELYWAERDTKGLSSLEQNQKLRQHFKRFYHWSNYQNTDEVFKTATSKHRYVISVAAYGEYFKSGEYFGL